MKKISWCSLILCFLGLWLIATPSTFGYGYTNLCMSDHLSGLALIVFGLLSRTGKRGWAQWGAIVTGLWLQCAPLVFWAHSPAAYLSDTTIGALALLCALVIPGLPGQREEDGASIPAGWSYNPSAWPQRLPIIFLATLGWLTARYLAAYELGYIYTAWDPFFESGTVHVLSSKVSASFPVPDAGLGAFAYLLEVLLACKGGVRRWRTMPWLVVLFGILVIPLSLTSIILIILQPVVVGWWCTLCLFAAFCMALMIPFAVDEVAAVVQFMKRQKNNRWKVFWKGGKDPAATEDTKTPALHAPLKQIMKSMRSGMTFRRDCLLSALVGIWAMFVPAATHFTSEAAADITYIVGALAVVISFFSFANLVRNWRRLNLLLGLVLLANLLYYYSGLSTAGVVNLAAMGFALIALVLAKKV